MTTPPDPDGRVRSPARTRDWTPSRRDAVVMNAAGLLVTVAALMGYGALAVARYPSGAFAFEGLELLLGLLGMVAAVVVLLVLHEGLHGLAMLPFGARPVFGVGVAGGGFLPHAYATAAGHRFRLGAYVVVGLAPSVVLTLLTVALVGLAPHGGWLVLPAAIHLGGCMGDWWMVALAARQPAGSRFEDLKDGLRVHLP